MRIKQNCFKPLIIETITAVILLRLNNSFPILHISIVFGIINYHGLIESILSYAGFRYKSRQNIAQICKILIYSTTINCLHCYHFSAIFFCGSHNLNGILIVKMKLPIYVSLLSQAQTNAKKCDNYEA